MDRRRKHRPIHPLLRHYGMDRQPASGRTWRNCKCPFHEDSTASAQYDEFGFRCFTCDVFFAGPLQLLMWREGMQYDDARRFYDDRFGDSNSDVPRGAGSDDSYLPGFSRHRPRHGTGLSPGRRPGASAGP